MTINFIIRPSGPKGKKPANRQPGFTKVYIRLRDGRHIDQTGNTNIIVTPKAWDSRLELLNAGKCPDEFEWEKINDALTALRKFITKKYISDSLEHGVGPFWLKDSLAEYRESGLCYQFDKVFDEFMRTQKISSSRRQQYDVLRRMVFRFEIYKKGGGSADEAARTDIRTFTEHTLSELRTFAENEHRLFKQNPHLMKAFPGKRDPRPRGNNTINDLLKKLRTFFHWCTSVGLLERNPFDNFKLGSELYGTPVYLTLDEVRAIFEADLSDSPGLARQRDVFVFQCCVGCRVGDLLKFKKSNVIDGALHYIPNKTISKNPRTIVIPLNYTAHTIVERYASSPTDKLLPFISTQKYNDSIKRVCQRVGINRAVIVLDPLTLKERKVPICDIASSHMARRTFTGNIYKKVKDPNLISSLTGHADGSKAFSRYRSIDEDIKKELVEFLD